MGGPRERVGGGYINHVQFLQAVPFKHCVNVSYVFVSDVIHTDIQLL